jgi:CheY-like chemotaxis protein
MSSAPPARTVVLYIEDDAANVRLVEHILRIGGDVDVVSAADGVRSVELARTRHPDLILLDLHLPDMSGEEIAAAIRADPATRAIPIVVLTGAADAPGRVLELGASAIVTKPFSVADVVAVVERLATKRV